VTESLETIVDTLATGVRDLRFGPPVTHVYQPLEYAERPHREYLRRFGKAPKEVLLLGMNPGPWGMAQTGVPFGEIEAVRDWMGITGTVGRPAEEHPRRPVQGFDCPRSEVSGRRLWGWARERFGSPDAFFARFFVWNYCPLVFMEQSGRNHTPDRLPKEESEPLFAACDRALQETVRHLRPRLAVGVGKFAEARLREVLDGSGAPIGCRIGCEIGGILHPSPASPAANRDWAGTVERQLAELGVELPG
jgi:single-strand selective monofunctional uracil DNA glycosylase